MQNEESATKLVINIVMTILAVLSCVISMFGAFFSWRQTEINRQQIQINRNTMVSEYLKILSSKDCAPHFIALTLATALKDDLINEDAIFDIAYDLENEHQSNILTPLFYILGEKSPTSKPIGIVEELKNDNTYFYVNGWAADDKKVYDVGIYVDGKCIAIDDKASLTAQRTDINKVFGRYTDKGAFNLKFSKIEISSGEHTLTVRLVDNDRQSREIYSRKVDFSTPFSKVICIKNNNNVQK